SHEVQDTLIRLDQTIGKLLAHLDSTVGKGNYVVGFTADHGVSEIPETVNGGRVSGKSLAAALEKVLEPALGPGTHVANTNYTDICLTNAAPKRLAHDPKLRQAAIDGLKTVQGVQYAYWGDDLKSAKARASVDPVV